MTDSPSGFCSGQRPGGPGPTVRVGTEMAATIWKLHSRFPGICVSSWVCVWGGRCLDAGVGPDARLCPQGLAQRGCSQDVLGRESRREGRRRGGKEGGREGSWEEMHDSWAAVEPSRRAGKGAACSAVGGCETLRLKQAVDTPASSGPPRSLGKGVSHRQGLSFVTACQPGLSPWL